MKISLYFNQKVFKRFYLEGEDFDLAGPGFDLDFGPIFFFGDSSSDFFTSSVSETTFLGDGAGFLLAGPALRAGPGFRPLSTRLGLSDSDSFLSDAGSGFPFSPP